MRRHLALAPLLLTLFAPAGCGIGENRVLFFTKTNMGVDVDTTPPTAEVTIARREGVIAPTFEEGKTLPVMASFEGNTNPFVRFFAGAGMSFSTGDAAVMMAYLWGHPSEGEEIRKGFKTNPRVPDHLSGTLSLSTKPSTGWLQNEPYKAGDTIPVIFGTDTSFGLKAAWSGQAGALPSTVKFGFNRKEFALAPVTMSQTANRYDVAMPSLLAAVNTSARLEGDVAGSGEGDVRHVQYFATGKAAVYLATQPALRDDVMSRLAPTAVNPAKLREDGQELGGELLRLVEGTDNMNRLQVIHSKALDMKFISRGWGQPATPLEARDKLVQLLRQRLSLPVTSQEDLDKVQKLLREARGE